MTDAHCHIPRAEARHFICDPMGAKPASPLGTIPKRDVFFKGWHPWFLEGFDRGALRAALSAEPCLGVGEIGLDRLRSREIPAQMSEAFAAQLEIAADFCRPVVLHGAKCWGEVVKACRPYLGRIPAFLFHGFSRSKGLLPEIEAMNGFISFSPALLNDHAINYRELAKAVPERMLLVESDATEETALSAPSASDVTAKLAELRGLSNEAMAAVLEENADRFLGALSQPTTISSTGKRT